ncbi:uncharacterized protein LOC126898148 [Daktulosphaira vitifoliae]|uniref:uncharacterized protein LOC126898148 n=1 Tax=Daktulosphaira vitifoliae TaxID=58002 RepID=UPI0021AABB82|nr:uncharacterized protein LOC126898148 [Daktulosphaira vitifoliae]
MTLKERKNIDISTDSLGKEDPYITEVIGNLEEELNILYSSMDANEGQLEDVHLLSYLRKDIFANLNYVLDGYPTSIRQFKLLFSEQNCPDKIDNTTIPELAICLNQNLSSNLPIYFNENDDNSQKETDITENQSLKRHLLFSEINNVSPSDPELFSAPNLQAKANKPILKTSLSGINNKSSLHKQRQSKEKKAWNEEDQKNILKILNIHYVQIKTFNSPYIPIEYQKTTKNISEDINIDEITNTIIKDYYFFKPRHKDQSKLFEETQFSNLISNIDISNKQNTDENQKKSFEAKSLLEKQ